MNKTLILYENEYRLNIDKEFHHRFLVLPSEKPEGRYVYAVSAEERRTWETRYIWNSRIYDERGALVCKKETICDYPSRLRILAFIAELIDFALLYYYEFEDFDIYDDNYFSVPYNPWNDMSIKNFEFGDTINADFEITIYFDDDRFACKETFNKIGIDTQKYNIPKLYKWIVSKSSAKLYYNKECVYTHPQPMLLLAHFGWYIAFKAR